MQIKCSKCQRVITIADDKIPKDKEKAMIKCPGCQQILVLDIPAALKSSAPPPSADKTVISTGPVHRKPARPRLCNPANDEEYPLNLGKNILGRDADISFPDDHYISRKHCLVEVIEKAGELLCILTDDGSAGSSGEPSTNGTFHNENRLTKYDKVFLEHLDKVRLGHTEFIFKND